MIASMSPLEPATTSEPPPRQHGGGGAASGLAGIMATTPALLHGHLGVRAALAHGSLPPGLPERIWLLVAHQHGWAGGISRSSRPAGSAQGPDDDENEAAFHANSSDLLARVALRLAWAIDRTGGDVSDEDLAAARLNGLSDEQVAEVIGHVALATGTSLFAKASRLDVDDVILVHPFLVHTFEA